jgi:hypothetical protein
VFELPKYQWLVMKMVDLSFEGMLAHTQKVLIMQLRVAAQERKHAHLKIYK